jgi:hypothetical protein
VIRDKHQAKAAYRLLDRPEVTHESVIRNHCQRTLEATAAPGDYLIIEDSMAAAYPGLAATEGLGPIGEGYTRGLWVHNTLVVKVDWQTGQQALLGLLGQRVWARPPESTKKRKKEDNHARHMREDRESQRWMAAVERTDGPLENTTWTYVADRESDIYELFQSAWLNAWHFVIRASHRRALAGAWEGTDLFTAAAQAPVRGILALRLPQEGRTAKLEVRSTTLELRGPQRPGGALANTTVGVVHVIEVDPPAGAKPLHWVLLTDHDVDTLEQCVRVIETYRRRWLVEEYHKALKTGLKVEDSQLTTAQRLSALIGILSVVAVFLVQRKLAARSTPDAELQSDDADPTLIAILKKTDPPKGKPTQRWFWLAIAKLGGFLARKGDGDPGWLTLWRGWQTLMILARGYELARSP